MNTEFDLTWLYLTVGLLAVLIAIALYIYRTNHRLAGMIIEIGGAKIKLTDSEPLFRIFTNTAADGVFVLQGTRFIMVNPALVAISGYSEQEVLSLDITDLAHPDHRQKVMQNTVAQEQTEAAPIRYEFKLVTKQGEIRWVELSAAPIVLHGQPSLVGSVVDITERRQIAEALRVSEEHYRLLADNASDVIWVMDFQGCPTYISPSVKKLLGHFVEEAMQQSLHQVLTPSSAAVAEKEIARIILAIHARRPVLDFCGEFECLRKDGSTVWTEVSISGMCNAAGQFISLLGVTRDISERQQTEERLRRMAQHDFLTGLPNRALFSDRLQQALADARRNGSRLALMFLDLDKFKPINDAFGHAVGDLVLKEVALRMEDCVRESDTVARIGGDEFVVLLRNIGTDQSTLQVAEKIRHALAQPFHVAGHVLGISASIGIALHPDHGSDEIELCKNSDIAMYRAKNSGRDNVQMGQSR